MLPRRRLGRAGFDASVLLLGGGGLANVGEAEAFRLLDAAVDLGITHVDLARGYGDAEERFGHWRRARPGAALGVLTKGGYGLPGIPDWTGEAVRRGVDAALQRLGVSRIEGFLLHSCNAATLRRGDVLRALDDARRDGRIVTGGYAGDEDDLHVALDLAAHHPSFGLVEQSLSVLDGRARLHTLPRARALGLGVVGKRALANAPWRFESRPQAPDLATQWDRWRRADLPDVGLAWDALNLRYAAFHGGADAVLVGTTRVPALEAAARHLVDGPLPADVLAALAPALARCDRPSVV